jgi:hypothetical protein
MDSGTVVLTVIVVVFVTAILSYISYRQKQSSWIGEVIDKKHEESSLDEDGSTPEKFKVIFKTQSGKKISVDMFEKEFHNYAIGDKAEKSKGEYFPHKL